MCFRPPDVDGGLTCPNCGKKINSTMGKLPSKCPFCKTPLDSNAESSQAGGAPVPPAPGTPKMPGAPGAPKAPGAPRVPGAPK